MKLVIIESPLGTREDGTRCSPEEFKKNQEYVLVCMLDSLRRGEVPFASHALYPLVLKDALPDERRLGMEAGFSIAEAFAQAKAYSDTHRNPGEEHVHCTCAIYCDRWISTGMLEGIEKHKSRGFAIEHRFLGKEWRQ